MQKHKNNIGCLRLFFASLVIIGHAPELIDGNRSREPLTRLFHTITLGDFAVDGFFLLSGYLISQSMFHSGSVFEYLKRRIFRIYPAFIAASLLCVYVLGPIAGANPGQAGLRPLFRMALLWSPPDLPGLFTGLPYPSVNGAMWTIRYEFGCYLMIAVFGVLGLLRRRNAMVAFSLITVIGFVVSLSGPWPHSETLRATLRLASVFLMGTLVFLFRDQIFPRLSWKIAIGSGLVSIALLFEPHTAELGLMTFGAIALFWLAFKASFGKLQRVNDSWDISYGVYLYGWPIAISILWFHRQISPWTLAAFTLPLAMIVGSASWWGLEKWTKDLFKAPSRRPVQKQPAEQAASFETSPVAFNPLPETRLSHRSMPE